MPNAIDGLKVTFENGAVNVAPGWISAKWGGYMNDEPFQHEVATPGKVRSGWVTVCCEEVNQRARLAVLMGDDGGGLPDLDRPDDGVFYIPLALVFVGADGNAIVHDKRGLGRRMGG